MQKKISLLLFVFTIIFPLSSYEWGGILKNTTIVKTADFEDIKVDQKNSLFIWYSTPIKQSGFNFFVEGLYTYHYYPDYPKQQKNNNCLDIDLLKISKILYNENFSVSVDIGRFEFSDFGSVYLNQNVDGLSFSIASRKNEYKFYIGYTGLLNELNVSILDKNGIAYVSDNQLYALAYPFMIFDFSMYFPNLFLNQNLSLEATVAYDFGAEQQNRYYAELQLDGLLFNSFYTLTAVINTNNFKSMGFFASLDFLNEINDNMYLDLGVEYASSDNENINSFVGITSRTVCNSFTSRETNSILYPYLKYAFVGDRISLNLLCSYIAKVNPDSINSEGFEVDLISSIKLFTDLQLQFGILSYVNLNDSIKNSNYAAYANISFAF